MDEDDGVHRLEGTSSSEKGGLIVKKKPPTFKVPQASQLGLDKLAALKRKEKEEAARKMSFDIDEEESTSKSKNSGKRKYRSPYVETPTYTGGISDIARERLNERLSKDKGKEKGVYATTKSSKKYPKREKTPRFCDEPKTPDIKLRNEVSKAGWEDDEEAGPLRRSSWDFPTPNAHKSSDFSERKSRKKYEETPRATPAHKYNAWMRDGATSSRRREDFKFDSTIDRNLWEEEQKRIDREWYNLDEGYDDENNPFASVSEEYTKKKEEQLEQRKKKRMSAQQRQINKDNELWERNRMLTSGVVHSVDFNEDFDEESVDRVHLLVHNIVPPFLDGRIVFTKQPEPVIPVR